MPGENSVVTCGWGHSSTRSLLPGVARRDIGTLPLMGEAHISGFTSLRKSGVKQQGQVKTLSCMEDSSS